MEAASLSAWRPIGQYLVERGLITEAELELALEEQRETSLRLGEILVARGWVSGPELAAIVSEQLGLELEVEGGFGAGLFAEIRRRHAAGRGLTVVQEAPEPVLDMSIVEPEPLSPEEELVQLRVQVAALGQELERERVARLAVEAQLRASS